MSRLTKLDRAVMELRGQLIVLGLVFGGGLALAVVMATQRPWFESFVQEKYKSGYANYPEPQRRVVDALASGKLSTLDFEKLGPEQRRQLYEDWIVRRELPRLEVPRRLTQWTPKFYLQCAEKTVICGRPDQQRRAIQFLKLCESQGANAVLQRLTDWAGQRRLTELRELLEQAG